MIDWESLPYWHSQLLIRIKLGLFNNLIKYEVNNRSGARIVHHS